MARRMIALTTTRFRSRARSCASISLSRALLVGLLGLGSFCSVLVFVGPHAHAQPNVWTLQSSEHAALERSPRIRSALASRETAYAYRTFSTMPRAGNPFVNLRAMIGEPDQSAATYSLALGIPFDVAGRRRAWRHESSAIVDEAEARLEATRNEVRAEARSAYVQVALAHAAHTVAEESADTARELAARVQARLDVSAATALDVALAESQYAEALANLARADRTLVESQHSFRQALDLAHDSPVEVATLPRLAIPEGLTIEAAVLRGQNQRKELAAWASTEKRWRAADGRLRAEAWAPATAAFEAEAQANQNTQKTIGAAVGFEVPVVSRNQGERAVAGGEAQAAGVERELAAHTIDRETSSSYRRLQAALAELAAIEERALPAAERTLAMVHTMLDAGVVDYFRVLTARGSAFALRSRRVEALREAWLCRIALERAMGGWEQAREE
ncbi:MAG: efflux system, outer rane lipoprotein CmeC [Myxococcaceae bacterium]|nr:efflux system, outer rane lipoprotein CmeC [Myxococcaceae bacterium]